MLLIIISIDKKPAIHGFKTVNQEEIKAWPVTK